MELCRADYTKLLNSILVHSLFLAAKPHFTPPTSLTVHVTDLLSPFSNLF